VGIFGSRSIDDEDMIAEIGKTANSQNNLINNSRVVILDARPKINAYANKYVGGGGFENLKYYRNCELVFCDIENIHEVRKCFQKVREIGKKDKNFKNNSNYQLKIENSGYIILLSQIFKAVNKLLVSMLVNRINVLVHCSDGWDRTS